MNMYFRKLSVAIACLLCSFSSSADEVSIHLLYKNGTKSTFQMTENTVMKFVNAELVLSNDNETLYFPLSELKNWTYTVKTTSINSVDANGPSVRINGNQIVITGIALGTNIQIYGVDGVLRAMLTIDSASQTVSTSSWPVGVYVIKCGDVSFKIQKQ